MAKKTKTQDSIPASKVQRAARFMKTGVKVGGNYVKHYAKKVVDPSLSKDELHEDNAKDIYDSFSELKGSALKIAQMMSMDRNLLPSQYSQKFQMAQYSAPPLSFPLVVRTFKKYFGKSPSDMFDSFTHDAVNAASIGQVHQAELDGKKFAVKIQYPGVAESISSDLKIVKPFAVNLLNLNEKDVDHYMSEVETMMLSETDYDLELKRSQAISEATMHIPNLYFPSYYPDLSCKHVLTMDWLEGMHLGEFLQTNPSQEVRNKIGQALWDFYDFQIHSMLEVHADPHPGNFLIRDDGTLGIIDFGCVKVIPKEYYEKYFILLDKNLMEEDERLMKNLKSLTFIYESDTAEEQRELFGIFKTMISLLGRPFYSPTFDFGNDDYFQEIYDFGEQTSNVKVLKNSKKPRGAKDGLYINRTYFGLYSILNELKANISTRSTWKLENFTELV
ncbi:AarF/ABC1/UbiB kinase family protein [Flammeovirgaceae bacterium SG7u.111]|nr:AarF/ABC1/UbiB kinase family protein [Flammeovirgaceae bacterium SG7u.132]WPO37891.1 AarF/ABC1/UbiB kinase family protein [Flammeovirgaceae bacterium SG7u.111]